MSSDIFRSVEKHLENGMTGQRANERQPNRLPNTAGDHDFIPLHPYSSSEALSVHDSDSMYQLKRANDSDFDFEDVYSDTHGSRRPVLYPTTQERTGFLPYGHWDASESELPLAKNHSSMGFAEDEEDQVRQLGDATIYPTTQSRPQDASETPPPRRGKFAWSNPELLERQIEKRQFGQGRQIYPVITWFLSCVQRGVFI